MSSQEAFIGPYITKLGEGSERTELANDYLTFTRGFLSWPLPFPGTQLWQAMKADKRIRQKLREVCKKSKEYTWGGGEPRCVLDYWTKSVKEEKAKLISSDTEMAATVLDFLFASQDATTSALAWTLAEMDSHPEILAKVNEEVTRVLASQKNEHETPSLSQIYHHLRFTQYVALEVLHSHPPVPMVPHLARKDTEVAPGFTVPKGSMVIPAIYASQQEGLFNKEKSEGSSTSSTSTSTVKINILSEIKESENCGKETLKHNDPDFDKALVFGAGQHKCPGRYYALQLVVIFLATVATKYQFKRTHTAKSSEYMYFPTIFPADNIYRLKKVM